MRMLLPMLVLAVACGKPSASQKTPRTQTADALSPFIAEEENFGHLKGTLKIHFQPEVTSYSIQSADSSGGDHLHLLTRSLLKSFDQGQELATGKLNVDLRALQKLAQSEYQVDIHFPAVPGKSQPRFLEMKTKASTRLVNWSEYMKLTLAAEEVEALERQDLAFYAYRTPPHPSLSPDDAEREASLQTYTVFHTTSERSRTYRISQQLPLASFLDWSGIKSPQQVVPEDLFFLPATSSERWWMNPINARNIVVARTSVKKMQEAFLRGFTATHTSLVRANGHQGQTQLFPTAPNQMVYLRLRLSRQMNTFTEKKSGKEIRLNRDEWGSCSYRDRFVHTAPAATDHEHFLQHEFQVLIDNVPTSLGDLKARVEVDPQDGSIKIAHLSPGSSVQYVIPALPGSTYTDTGRIENTCPFTRLSIQKTNVEHSLTASMEAFVEKIAR